jgi:hypothetical protein
MDVEAKKADAKAKMCDADVRKMDTEAKIRVEDTRIMLADLGSMDDDTRTWFLKKRIKIRAREACSTPPLSSTMAPFLDYICCSGHTMCTI